MRLQVSDILKLFKARQKMTPQPEGRAPKDLAEGDQAQMETQEMKRKHVAHTLDVRYVHAGISVSALAAGWSKNPQSGAG